MWTLQVPAAYLGVGVAGFARQTQAFPGSGPPTTFTSGVQVPTFPPSQLFLAHSLSSHFGVSVLVGVADDVVLAGEQYLPVFALFELNICPAFSGSHSCE